MRVKLRLPTLLLGLSQPMMAFAQAAPSGAYWDGPGPWHMWGGWGFGWVFPLLMMVFMVGLCFYFMTRMPFGHGHSGRDTTASALEILNERFAKGEISKEEFEEKRTILTRRV